MTSSSTSKPAATSLRNARIAAGLAALLLVAAALLGAGSDLVLALPVVFLVGALLVGRYPGLQTLTRIAARLRRRPRAPRTGAPPSDVRTLAPRALRLLFGTRILRGPPSVTPAAS